ncbi:HYR domain-containing protein [Psychroflexus sediminis]|uniref:Por secretion system C-terminal sorting domain-containing protein n=1 Tax=Psychroflexus sediminis TaxID=470826 RepID=A0A1G7VZP0_9FLAO|nr:HYR domain-containing protein [Psychroflexus sediminis]SDG64889.1 Por secretion system C-terminal sorting domain-containing protein [Psychroflexus sediminis]
MKKNYFTFLTLIFLMCITTTVAQNRNEENSSSKLFWDTYYSIRDSNLSKTETQKESFSLLKPADVKEDKGTSEAKTDFTVVSNSVPILNCINDQTLSTNTDSCAYTHTGTNWDPSVSEDVVKDYLNKDNWSATASRGTTSIDYAEVTGQQRLRLAYNGNGTPRNGTYTYSITANATETISFDWFLQGCHSWFQSQALYRIWVGTPDTIVETLYSGGGCSFSNSGNSSVTVTAGEQWGFIITGTHGDIANLLNGRLEIYNNIARNYTLSGATTGTGTSLDGVDFNLGTTTVTWTAEDIDGNISNCNFDINVEDTAAPTVVTQNLTVELDEFGAASITATDVDNGSSDNCGIESLALDVSSFDCSTLGENTVTLTVTDVSGNQANATAIVTVVDNTSPAISNIPSNITVSNTPGSCDATVNWAETVLDLNQDQSSIGTAGSDQWQSFTAGQSGALSQIEIFTNGCVNRAFTMEIYAGDGISGTLLYTNFYNLGNVCSGWEELNITAGAGLIVQSGNIYTVRFLNDIGSIVANESYNYGNYYSNNYGLNPGWQLTMRTSVSTGVYATDNCTVQAFTSTHNSGDVFNVGSTTVTYTATDASGNSTTSSFTVTVQDNTAPTVLTKDLSVELDEFGAASITAAEVDNGSSDNCDIESLALDVTSFDCSTLGENTVTLTVTDTSGNQATETAIITVTDTTVPTVITQDIIVELDANGEASIASDQIDNGSSDNCGLFNALIYGVSNDYALQNSSRTSSLGFNVGFVSMNTANDPISFEPVTQIDQFLRIGDVLRIKYRKAGSTQDRNIQWRGNNNSLGDVTWETSTTRTTFTIEQQGKIAGDLFDPTEPFFIKSDFSVLGTTKYLNSSSGVTMADLPEAWRLNIITGYFPGFSFSNTETKTQLDFQCSDVGINPVTLYATDVNGNISTGTATVTVVDNSLPTAVTQNLSLELDEFGAASITAAQIDNGSSDNCGIDNLALDVTSFDCSTLGENTVTLTVTDSSGNQATATAIVTVTDTAVPAAVTQNLTVELDEFGAASITAAQIDNGSSDNCGIEALALDVTSFDCSTLGENTVTLTVTDTSGNQATATAIVTVTDTAVPAVVTQNLSLELDEFGAASITAAEVDNGSSDNCGIDNLALDVTSFNCSTLGENTVTLTVTDSSGNQSTATALVTVTDTAVPVAVAQNLSVELDEFGAASITAAEVDNGSLDNCGIDNLALDVTSFNCSTLGENTVTLTATDASGNQSAATAIVTVTDTAVPAAVAQNLSLELDEFGAASITAAQIDNGSSDNCGIEVLALDVTSFDCSTLGENTVTLTVTDTSGNQSTATAIVTVVDNLAPILETVSINVSLDSNNTVSIQPIDVLLSVTDNCSSEGNITLSLDQDTFTSAGEYEVNLTATDAEGNSTTVSVIVVVETTLGVRDLGLDLNIKLSPNPASQFITIEGSNFKLDKVAIYDMNGRLITTGKDLSIDVSNLSSGVYFAKVDANDGKTSKTLRFIKK